MRCVVREVAFLTSLTTEAHQQQKSLSCKKLCEKIVRVSKKTSEFCLPEKNEQRLWPEVARVLPRFRKTLREE